MPQDSTPKFASDPNLSAREAQLDELHRRIETLEAQDEAEFGEFTRTDWIICIVGALILPSLVLLWIGR